MLRVAYDIAFLGKFFDKPDEQSGVFRVVEELFTALSDRDDFQVMPTSICGDDPLADSINSLLYLEKKRADLKDDFAPSFQSQLGLDRSYANVFRAFAGGDVELMSRYSPRAFWLRRKRGLLYRLAYTFKWDRLHHYFDSDRFDVFHSPFLRLPTRELTAKLPRVLTVYDLIFIHRPEFMTEEINRVMAGVFSSIDVKRDWFTAISEFTKGEFCEYTGADPSRVEVTPLAASDYFRPVRDAARIAEARERFGIPDGDYVLSLAAIQPRKNLLHLIRCFLRLIVEQPSLDLNLVLAGKPSWIFAEVLTASAAGSRICLTGFIPDEDLSAIYSGATAFAFPSLYEGFGLPALEAMQCGTPVITSNNTAFPEVVGDAGIMVDPMNEDALCQAMLDIATNSELREQLRLKGQRRAQEFTWAACAAKTVDLYRRAID